MLLSALLMALSACAWANPMRFGLTDSPGAFRVDLPGSWARGSVAGLFEDVSGCRLQAIESVNAERTPENTYPGWKTRFEKQGYTVQQVRLGGVPALLARSTDNVMGLVLRDGHQLNLMLNVSNPEVNVDELLTQFVKTFIWLN